MASHVVPRRPAKPELLKDLNRALVLSLLRRHPLLSRTFVAHRSGLSKASASALVDDFVQAGLLHERGTGRSNGGRPPRMLEYVPGARLAVGVEFAHDAVVGVVTDLDASVIRNAVMPSSSADPRDVLAATVDLARELLDGLPRERVLGLGFASPGLVDIASGTVVQAVDVGWRDVPAAAILSERVGLPAVIANRAKAAALAERWCGDQAGGEHLMYVFLGSGVSAGVVLGDELYVGATSSAGEIGHVTVYPDGPVCDCGNRGCLHVYAGEAAIARRARELVRTRAEGSLLAGIDRDVRSISADSVIDAALAGDPLACQVIDEVATSIGIVLANAVNLVNPDAIIVGGPTSRAGPALLGGIEGEIRCRALTIPGRHVTIALSRLGLLAGAIGGAVLVVRQAPRTLFGTRSVDRVSV